MPRTQRESNIAVELGEIEPRTKVHETPGAAPLSEGDADAGRKITPLVGQTVQAGSALLKRQAI